MFRATYRYSPAGDITKIVDHVKSVTRLYQYDELHRLISERSSAATLVPPSRIVRLTFDYEGTGPFNAPKQVEARGSVYRLKYDANGNMIRGPALSDPATPYFRSLTYNADNRPAVISQPGAIFPEAVAGAVCPSAIELSYDGENKRFRKSSAAGTTLYIGQHYEVIDGTPVRYIFAGNLRVAQLKGNTLKYLHKDHLMSTIAVSNKNKTRFMGTLFIQNPPVDHL